MMTAATIASVVDQSPMARRATSTTADAASRVRGLVCAVKSLAASRRVRTRTTCRPRRTGTCSVVVIGTSVSCGNGTRRVGVLDWRHAEGADRGRGGRARGAGRPRLRRLRVRRFAFPAGSARGGAALGAGRAARALPRRRHRLGLSAGGVLRRLGAAGAGRGGGPRPPPPVLRGTSPPPPPGGAPPPPRPDARRPPRPAPGRPPPGGGST